ncbi:hypothetical protein GCM10007100_40380 [Roseibacillus persicicus]|uniref:Uncharacterized protein n=1 Tax=Roseibacillus persicicus TaxID=454148 RepID=A0A918WRI3_9BACT|nr:hypothetical protein GCM10007100_40380 [Roseibacillus persicicus]
MEIEWDEHGTWSESMLKSATSDPQIVYASKNSFGEALKGLEENFKVDRREVGARPIVIARNYSDSSYSGTFHVYVYSGHDYENNGETIFVWGRVMQTTVGGCFGLRMSFDEDNDTMSLFAKFEPDGPEELVLEQKRFSSCVNASPKTYKVGHLFEEESPE